VNLLYGAGACVILAQLLGIYALITRKADLIFALVMALLLVLAAVFASSYIYGKIG
jgi:hypothetical protein